MHHTQNMAIFNQLQLWIYKSSLQKSNYFNLSLVHLHDQLQDDNRCNFEYTQQRHAAHEPQSATEITKQLLPRQTRSFDVVLDDHGREVQLQFHHRLQELELGVFALRVHHCRLWLTRTRAFQMTRLVMRDDAVDAALRFRHVALRVHLEFVRHQVLVLLNH